MSQRQRNQEHLVQKMDRLKQKEEEEQYRQAQNRALKEQLKSNIEVQKKGFEEKVKN